MRTALTAIGLFGGLLYGGSAPAQITDITPPSNPQLNPEQQQFVASAMRLDLVKPPANGSSGARSLNVTTPSGSVAHIFPTIPMHQQQQQQMSSAAAGAADTGPLLYHNGGRIVEHPHFYQIFWAPKTLQNGGATGYSAKYVDVNVALALLYNGHGIGTVTTQYFQNVNGGSSPDAYPENDGFWVDAVVDFDPYPTSGCNNPATPGNCINDGQLQAEIVKVIQAKNWQIGPNNIFVVYTSAGEGSCMAADSKSCAYEQYCGYHSAIIPQNNDLNSVILYADIPYGVPQLCLGNVPSPNKDAAADTGANVTTHEITETITDPFGNAWFTAQGNEIGDICAYVYQNATYANGSANQSWRGFPFLLQTEYDNHTGRCVQIGPQNLEAQSVALTQ